MTTKRRFELVGGPKDGEKIELSVKGWPEHRISGMAQVSSIFVDPIPKSPSHVIGTYKPENVNDYSRNILRWQGWE
jgi:hypothetical protein